MGVYGNAEGKIVFLDRDAAYEAALAATGGTTPDPGRSIEDFLTWVMGEDGGWQDGTFWVSGKISSDTDAVFEAIAPYVEAGSFVQWVIEDNSMSRDVFDGETVVSIEPTIIWPDVPLKTGQKHLFTDENGDLHVSFDDVPEVAEGLEKLAFEQIVGDLWH